jgi:enterochelin esterase family protein
MRLILSLMFAAALTLAQPAPQAQRPRPTPRPSIISPEVHSDCTVTFRLRAPNAKAVNLSLEGSKPLPMEKDESGVWSVNTPPLEPDYYGYTFSVDGVAILDPGNSSFKPNLLNVSSRLHVPGPATLPWEINDVNHGTVDHHFYKSTVVGDQRDYYVYTPPGYDAGPRCVIRSCISCTE